MRRPMGVTVISPGPRSEQGHAQFVLQLAHRHAQRGLADATGFGGVAEMSFAGNRDDVAQFVQGHGDNTRGSQRPDGFNPGRHGHKS